jgi:hypothetical protein
MENNNTNLIKSTMTYGAILGFIVVIYSILLWAFNIMPVGISVPLILLGISLTIYYLAIYFSTKKIRNDLFPQNFSYQQAMLTGVLVSFFAAIITSFYGYIQNALIDPGYMERVLTAQKDWMITSMSKYGATQAQLDSAMDKLDESMKNPHPLKDALNAIMGSTILGFLLSLITAAFLKKKNPIDDNSIRP